MLLLQQQQQNNDVDVEFTTPNFTVSAVFIGAGACTIAEGLPFGNDNLNIPVITAFIVDKFGR